MVADRVSARVPIRSEICSSVPQHDLIPVENGRNGKALSIATASARGE
jgi:hypothetical protein